MALVNCPECSGLVSTEASICPHCGFPMRQHNHDLYNIKITSAKNLKRFPISYNRLKHLTGIQSYEEIDFILKHLPFTIIHNISFKTAETIQAELLKYGYVIEIEKSEFTTPSDQEKADRFAQTCDKLVCIRCGSTQITTGTKGYGLVRGFLGSNKTVNRCGKCGYSWEP